MTVLIVLFFNLVRNIYRLPLRFYIEYFFGNLVEIYQVEQSYYKIKNFIFGIIYGYLLYISFLPKKIDI